MRQGRRVVFVLGGPGAGKGTQCSLLKKCFPTKIEHVSAGELLRTECNSNTPRGNMIRTTLQEGKIISGEITVELLKSAYLNSSANIFVIDGFPRLLEQGLLFEKEITHCEFTLYFDAPKAVLEERLIFREKENLKKGQIRNDDNQLSREKRFKVHYESCLKVVDYYANLGKLITVSAEPSVEEIHKNVLSIFNPLLEDHLNPGFLKQ